LANPCQAVRSNNAALVALETRYDDEKSTRCIGVDGRFNRADAGWRVVGGKLYLNFNAEVRQMWVMDVPGFIISADKNWPDFPDDAKFGG
jgi:hypothetical protein